MKPPSKNMSTSLRGASPGGRAATSVSVGKQSPATAADMQVIGEGGVSNPPGNPGDRSTKPFAGAVGGHFGGSK